jgi:hypothetical protein
MTSILLTHLGESIPPYLRDCVHQLRIWNPELPIYIILSSCHTSNEFWTDLILNYSVKLVYTETLSPTCHHTYFLEHFAGDINFRKGYWRHVKERFFFLEELMATYKLTHCISMEYDVLVYMNLRDIFTKLKQSHQTLRMVRDNDERGHPAFLYIPSFEHLKEFNMFLTSIIKTPLEDMQSLAQYANSNPEKVHYFPAITEKRKNSILNRKSKTGHTSQNSQYLSEDSEYFNCLFDSLVVGQWIGGIDPRNIKGNKLSNYENESALYSIKEMTFVWKKSKENNLWIPMLDGRPLCTIHMHCKALRSFLSDRPDYPQDDYNVVEITEGLLAN